jgi:RNA-directed DNA polymerase
MSIIRTAVVTEAHKLIQRHQRYCNSLFDNAQRIQRRSGQTTKPNILIPSYWSCDPGFNPYHVLANADSIATRIIEKMKDGSYFPRPGIVYEVPKGEFDKRKVTVFQVADNAVSRVIFLGLRNKNQARFSARSYGYRSDISLHDAVNYAFGELSDYSRIFIAEYDFSKYFDMISHRFLDETLKNGPFCVTDIEHDLLMKFARAPALSESSYSAFSKEQRSVGLPQGTSVSLFLANIAAYKLDQRLERLGIGFCRYADDTVIWSSEYGQVSKAFEVLNEVSKEMGVKLNLDKSDGINLLADEEESKTELSSKRSFDFLGYKLSQKKVGIRSSSVNRAKARLSRIVHSNLIGSIEKGQIVPRRWNNPVDRDYVVMIWQIRRYLYGDLTEKRLRAFLSGLTPSIRFKGYLSAYPLVNDEEQLKDLDGWLLNTIYFCLIKRTKILNQSGYSILPVPHGLAKQALLKLRAQSTNGSVLDLRVPSFLRMNQLLRKASHLYGANQVCHARSFLYYFD